MGRPTSEKVGRGACPCCGTAVTYRRSAGGFLTHKCDECDSTGYAEPGGKAYAARMATIKGEAAPAPAPKGEEPTPPKTKKTFSLGDI